MRDFLRRIRSRIVYHYFEKRRPGDYISFRAFDYYRCIFIHIPKTAGLSVNKTLFGNLGSNHKGIHYFKKLYSARTFEKYFKFTFVRNPYTRLHSAFLYLKKGGINENDKNWADKYISDIDTFEDFVLHFLNTESIYSYILLYPQSYFITTDEKKTPLDFIGRFENLHQDFDHIRQVLGIQRELKTLNINKQKKALELSEEVKDKIYMLYKSDFELLGYEK